jgi:peptidoglycan-associated lipoprotein
MHLKISWSRLLIVAAAALFASNHQINAEETKIVNPAKSVVNPALKKKTPPNFREPDNSTDSLKTEDFDAQLREVLLPIYFSLNSSALSTGAIASLDRIAVFLKSHPSVRLLAQGNADDPGNREYNITIGDNRAKSVKNHLTGSGIVAGMVETTSYGKERPVIMNCGSDESCHAKNRRVEWQVLSR